MPIGNCSARLFIIGEVMFHFYAKAKLEQKTLVNLFPSKMVF